MLDRRHDGLRGRGRDQRGGTASISRRLRRSPAGWPSAESREGLPCRPTARSCWSATRDRRNVSVIDVNAGRSSARFRSTATTCGRSRSVPTARRGYIANMRNRGFATTSNNIDLGWVLGQRLTRVAARRLAEPRSPRSRSTRGARPRPTPTAWPSARTSKFLAVSLGGTHEVMIFRTDWHAACPGGSNGSRDLIAHGTAQGRRPVSAGSAGRTAHRAGLRPRRQDALRRQLSGRRRAGGRRRVGPASIRTIPLGGPEDALAGPPRRDPVPRRPSGRSTSGTVATPATATATPTASTSTRSTTAART